MLSRKKRRGIIEKRRRDRINTSLTELRNLVPAACEKQGSAKLEKAEILQMTVDHLKMLHSKGVNALTYDYDNARVVGFQQCVSEVSKYLRTREGLDINNPLVDRLLRHLNDFGPQRTWYGGPPSAINTSQTYQCSSPLSLIGNSHHLPRPPPPIPIPPPSGLIPIHYNTSLNTSGSSLNSSLEMNSSALSNSINSSNSINNSHSHSLNSFENSANACEPLPTSTQSNISSSNPTITPLTTVSSTADGYNYLHHNPHQHPSLDSYHHLQHLHQQHSHSQVGNEPPPYRPWRAPEVY